MTLKMQVHPTPGVMYIRHHLRWPRRVVGPILIDGASKVVGCRCIYPAQAEVNCPVRLSAMHGSLGTSRLILFVVAPDTAHQG